MRIAVVGLGAAGLRTCMLLEQTGIQVVAFEARDRIGGRIHTVRQDGLVYEAGGEWIDGDHTRMISLADELGVQLQPSGSWPRRILYNRQECTEATLWNDALEDELRLEASAKDLCADLSPIPWNNTQHHELDHQTLADFLTQTATSERGLWWMVAKMRSDEGDDPERVGLLGWLCGIKHYLDRDGDVMSAYRVTGGADRLCHGMQQRIAADMRFNHVLKKIHEENGKVNLSFEDHVAVFDHVILTLPPPALERIVFEPALPVKKRCAIEACEMGRMIKICWEFESAWWLETESRGSIHTDGPLQQIWDGTRGERPVLTAYICGEQAVNWIQKPAAIRKAHEELCLICPEAKTGFVRGWMHDWATDPFSLGGFSHLAPGYVLDYMLPMIEANGRIHFAGEHTALWTGFIEGALESAERVVTEVLS